ncbi:hypothetical protein [Spirosoma sordidisoli]|uniref:Uncharacterized protein n=1 Tax=Spirosoma sordidisoli TaxID=2502893 RepID=A0A4Q2UMT5_9BACT|nr:hypothetical protein [Spirosoma sordidisoli]RYC70714.1 hypothetical protein EQG79_00750 [Spirosoma sordidisoli]
MENTYYSPAEKTLFWVAGYTGDLNTIQVSEQVKYLVTHGTTFAEYANVDMGEVRTDVVRVSRRYKNMRVFWTVTETPPADAFEITNNWTMWNWLTD